MFRSKMQLGQLSVDENTELLATIQTYLQKSHPNLGTLKLTHGLSAALIKHFIAQQVILDLSLYDQAQEFDTALEGEAPAYDKHVIGFAIKNAIFTAYYMPVIDFFNHALKTTDSNPQLGLQLFAIKKLQQSLKTYHYDYQVMYGFLKKHFIAIPGEPCQLSKLQPIYFSRYRILLNQLDKTDKSLAGVKEVFNTLIHQMQKDVYQRFTAALTQANYHYQATIHSLANILYFDATSRQQCKNALFDYLFASNTHFTGHSTTEINYNNQLEGKATLYLDCIEEQLRRWMNILKTNNQNKKSLLPLTMMQTAIHEVRENHAEQADVECLARIIAIANAASPTKEFLKYSPKAEIELHFYDVIKRFYKLFSELNLLPDLNPAAEKRKGFF